MPNKIGIGEKILVTNLKIIGEINGTDLRFIREMAGSDVKGNSTSGNLSVLDLSEAKFVAGGDYYYKDYEDGCYTSNDIIGKYAFRDCKSLTSVIIPSSVTEIREYAFFYCSGLKSIYVYAETVPSIGAGAFNGFDSENCTLYVPKGTYDVYRYSWGGIFENIVEFDATNIRNIVAEPEVQENARYAVNGRRLIAPVKGINLVKYNNGRVKKEIVK